MAHQIIRQPDGKLAVFSSNTDCWVLIDAQCSRWDRACDSPITQEDLLCDTCREGCCLIEFRPLGSDELIVAGHNPAPEISFLPQP